MSSESEEISQLKQEIQALKTEMELQWQSHLQKEKEISELQEQKHKEVLQKQDAAFFKQKIEWLSGFALMTGAFIYVIKKLKEAKQEIKELLKK